MNDESAGLDLESQLAELLSVLSNVQADLLDILALKREMMAKCDTHGMAQLQSREVELNDRLQSCADRREELLQIASGEGFTANTISQLAQQMSSNQRKNLEHDIKRVSSRMRLLQHQGLINWVLAQRSLLHVSQLLEIIATGGRLQPTYGKGESVHARGSLVDRAG